MAGSVRLTFAEIEQRVCDSPRYSWRFLGSGFSQAVHWSKTSDATASILLN